jgi:hypothetical protein
MNIGMSTAGQDSTPARQWVPVLVRLVAALGLGVDAGIHFALAPSQPPGGPGQLSQVTLFYAEGVAAAVATVLLLATGSRVVAAFAFLVAASAVGAVLLYRYVNVGPLGPLPNMYEPGWYPVKVATTIAEAVAVVGTAFGVLRPRGRPAARR